MTDAFEAVCPFGTGAVGVHGQSGGLIDKLGLICASLPTAAKPAPPPIFGDGSTPPAPAAPAGLGEDACRAYAANAIRQVETGLALDCGLTGPRYTQNYDDHFNWCRTADPGVVASERAEREKEIKTCAAR
jgi:hypothetical protein